MLGTGGADSVTGAGNSAAVTAIIRRDGGDACRGAPVLMMVLVVHLIAMVVV